MQGRMLTIDHLPNEILLLIFEYLPAEDLSMTMPLVSKRWGDLSQRASLWERLTFTPPINMSDDQVSHALQTMPRLKSFRLKHGKLIDQIVDTLCRHCPNIRRIVMERKRGPSKQKLKKLLIQYSDIECLDVFVPATDFHIDYAKLYGSRTRAASLLLFDKYKKEVLERFDGKAQGYGLDSVYISSYDEILLHVSARKDILQYLAIDSEITTNLLGVICECTHLRGLLLYDCYSTVSRSLDMKSLRNLQNLEHLQLCFPLEIMIVPLAEEFEMPRLVKLEIVAWYLENSTPPLIFNLCPNLQFLKLRMNILTDEYFTSISKCPHLEHIDVSFNEDLTDMSVKYIADGCAALQFLDVSHCFSMTDDILNILSSLNHIQELRLDHNDFTGKYFGSIPLLLPNLSILSIKHCTRLRREVIEELKTTFPKLQLVEYSVIEELKTTFPKVQLIEYLDACQNDDDDEDLDVDWPFSVLYR